LAASLKGAESLTVLSKLSACSTLLWEANVRASL
jgi:hypothetical protein